MKQLGKQGKKNLKANKELKKLYQSKGIDRCEIRFEGHNWLFPAFAHRHKRDWYKVKGREHLLASFNQTVIACQYCHNKIEYDKELTEQVFLKLRGEDDN